MGFLVVRQISLSSRCKQIINPIIYAEGSIRFGTIEELEEVLDPLVFRKEPIPWEAAFLAGAGNILLRLYLSRCTLR